MNLLDQSEKIAMIVLVVQMYCRILNTNTKKRLIQININLYSQNKISAYMPAYAKLFIRKTTANHTLYTVHNKFLFD